MSTATKSSAHVGVAPFASLAQWFKSPLGAYLLDQERAWIDAVVPDVFGYHALQFGLCEIDLLAESRITHRVSVAPTDDAGLRAHWHELPIDSHSVDLVLLPHILEFVDNPHEVLREVDRVLRPEGRAIIIGFNPWSLFGARRILAGSEAREAAPWNGNFVSLIRMKDWLQLLSFEPASGKLCCYVPPVQSVAWQRRCAFFERWGDRWWGVAGGVYMLEAVKRVHGMRLMTPAWSAGARKERKLAAAVRSAAHLRSVK